MRLAAVISFVGVLCIGTPALAQTAQDRRWCEGEDAATPDQRINGCSAVIRGGRDKGEKLAEAFNNRGMAYRSRDDGDRAILDYSQAIRINPKFASAYNNRGVAYDHKGDYDRAVQDYEQAIKLMPTFAQAYFNRGNAYLGKSQYAQAIDDYNQAIRLKPDFAAAFDNRCWARAVVGILQHRRCRGGESDPGRHRRGIRALRDAIAPPAHFPANARPGLDPRWKPVRRSLQNATKLKSAGTLSDSSGTESALAILPRPVS